jgi:Ca-activated chloride channel family protein
MKSWLAVKMSQTLVFGILLAGSAQASSWSDLWYRRDQQGQHALQAGDSKRAAELFADPRHQAYAELQSGQYAAAAKRLEPFADADSQYNRGNALAKSGDLQGALNAYDGALGHADLESSLRGDAQHNRDLVARQLQAQEHQQHSSSGQPPPPQGKEDGKQQGNESKDGSGASRSSSQPATAGSTSPSAGSTSPSQGENKTQPDVSRQSGSPPTTPSSPSSSAQAIGGDEQRQAAGAGSDARGGTEQMNSRKAQIGDSVQPQTEQQLALEQWLRQIPDDPGGLLRRKFMIEHLMKQQQVQP